MSNAGRERATGCSLLVRNLSRTVRIEDLRYTAEKYGRLRDIYIPKDYYSGEPRGIGFLEYANPRDAEDAMFGLDRKVLDGKEISVVLALQGRKMPADFRGGGGGGGYGSSRRTPPRSSSRRGRSRSRSRSRDRGRRARSPSYSRSRSPRRSGRSRSRSASRGRSYTPSRSPVRSRSPRRAASRSPAPKSVDPDRTDARDD